MTKSRVHLMEEMLKNARRLKKDRSTDDIGAAIEGAALDFYEKSDRERAPCFRPSAAIPSCSTTRR